MQSKFGRMRLVRSRVVVSLVALGMAGMLAGCQRKEAEAPELPVRGLLVFSAISDGTKS